MIEITIKTLDSQNHVFSVEDHITVRELKDIIADSVDVPADSQRLIYCGRVLTDEKKLSEYDANGKVIHLVQRAPPTTNRTRNSGTNEGTSGQDGSGGSGGMPAGRWTYMGRIGRPGETNATYLGAMAFPADLMESRGITPRPPTSRLTPHRMYVAETMLDIARGCLAKLEKTPQPRNRCEPPKFDSKKYNLAEMTTQREAARASRTSEENLPGSSSPNGTSSMPASSATDMTKLASSSQQVDMESGDRSDTASKADSSEAAKASDTVRSSTVSADDGSSSNDSKTSLPSTSSARQPRSRARSDSRSPTRTTQRNTQISRLISSLADINTRLTPFLQEYQRLITDESPDINPREAQNTFDQVSEAMHALAHANHALSDLICNFSQPAPRLIVCRPVLMRHSSFVQTGFPIQAQMINVSRAPRQDVSRDASSTATSANAATNTQTPSRADASTQRDNSSGPQRPESTTAESAAIAAQTAAAAASAAAGEAESAARAAANAAASAISAALSSVGVDTQPGVSVRVHVDPLTPLIAASAVPPQPSAPPANANASANATNATANNGSTPRNANSGRNWEILMDVGSGSINFNSIDAPFGSQNGANNPDAAVVAGPFPWGSAPPPDFIQNLIQRLATEIGVNNNNNSTNNNNNNGNERRGEGETPAPPRTREGASQSTQSRSSASGTTVGASSQPGTSSRLHYLTVTPGSDNNQEEFDPFLPCNSDHVRRFRDQTRETFLTPPRVTDNREAWLPHGLGRISEYLPATGREYEPRTIPPDVLSQLQTRLGSSNITTHTVSELLQSISNSYQPGESIIMDVVMTAGRYVTIEDLLNPNRLSRSMINNMRPSLLRLLNEYFNMEIYSEAAVEAAIDKIDKEVKPFFRRMLAPDTGLGRHLHEHVDVEASISRVITHFVPLVIKDIFDGNDQRRSEGQVGRNGQGVTTARSNNPTSNNPNPASRPRSSASTITLRAIQSFSLGLPIMPRLQPDQPIFDFANALVNLVFLCCKDISISQVIMTFAHWLTWYVDKFARRWFLSELACWFVRLQPNHDREFCSYFCRRFVVYKSATNGSSESEDDQAVEMDIDETITTNNPPAESPPEQPLPELVLESESWQQSVPPDWVPIITRDRREQRRAAAQGPLSDSYLSGMPSKRRKIVTSAKPHHTLTKAISESMSVALGAAGIAGSGLDGVAENAACDVDLRSAFKEQLRSTVESTLRSHPDFTPDKYPNAAKYFNLPPHH